MEGELVLAQAFHYWIRSSLCTAKRYSAKSAFACLKVATARIKIIDWGLPNSCFYKQSSLSVE